jgi:hypothetical protein
MAGAWARSRATGWSGPRCFTTCASGGTGGPCRWPGWPGSRSRPRTGAAESAARFPLELGARGLAALYAGTPVAALRRAGLASGGNPAADAALDGAFAATPYMLDSF